MTTEQQYADNSDRLTKCNFKSLTSAEQWWEKQYQELSDKPVIRHNMDSIKEVTDLFQCTLSAS